MSLRTSLNRQIQLQYTHRYRYLHLGGFLKRNLLKSDSKLSFSSVIFFYILTAFYSEVIGDVFFYTFLVLFALIVSFSLLHLKLTLQLRSFVA